MLQVFNVPKYPDTEHSEKTKFEKSPVTSITGIHDLHNIVFPVTTYVFPHIEIGSWYQGTG